MLAAPADGKEITVDKIKYSKDVKEQQEIYNNLDADVDSLQIIQDAKYEAFKQAETEMLDARSMTAKAIRAQCDAGVVLSQLKFADTPDYLEEERQRLHDSANAFRECAGLQ